MSDAMLSPPGWVDDPASVQTAMQYMAAQQGMPAIFGLVGEGLDDPLDDKTACLWDAERQLFGRPGKSWSQGAVGTCVAFGWGRGANDLLAIDAVRGVGTFPGEVATEPIYAGSRVEIGGGQIRGDGSLGAWAGQWLTRWGVLVRGVYGAIDLREYNESRAREWGYSGCPDSLEPIAKKYPVRTVAQVKSSREAWVALGSGYPVPVCSSQGFTTTLQGGFCEASGIWQHCMVLRGRLTTKNRGRAFVVQNSWGDNLKGEPVVEDHTGKRIELPEGCFCADWNVIEGMLRQGDSFALSGVSGFPVKPLDWIFGV